MKVLRTVPLFLVENLQNMKEIFLFGALRLRIQVLQFQGIFDIYISALTVHN